MSSFLKGRYIMIDDDNLTKALVLTASASSRTLQSDTLPAFNAVVSSVIFTLLQHLFKITDKNVRLQFGLGIVLACSDAQNVKS